MLKVSVYIKTVCQETSLISLLSLQYTIFKNYKRLTATFSKTKGYLSIFRSFLKAVLRLLHFLHLGWGTNMWRTENNIWDSGLCFYHVVAGSNSSHYFSPESYLTGSGLFQTKESVGKNTDAMSES